MGVHAQVSVGPLVHQRAGDGLGASLQSTGCTIVTRDRTCGKRDMSPREVSPLLKPTQIHTTLHPGKTILTPVGAPAVLNHPVRRSVLRTVADKNYRVAPELGPVAVGDDTAFVLHEGIINHKGSIHTPALGQHGPDLSLPRHTGRPAPGPGRLDPLAPHTTRTPRESRALRCLLLEVIQRVAPTAFVGGGPLLVDTPVAGQGALDCPHVASSAAQLFVVAAHHLAH
mmetsp:Transcript_51286/g.109807  ORF Transcript_51286/g.109807 Transcript_51286/m.109807 type:complete len:227 (-) Transcript_51286:681-1361(-)